MARIIDADILKENCRITGEFMNNFECVSLKTLGEIIDKQPTIEAEPVKQEWISVEDRLPKKDEEVLVYWDDGFEIGRYVGGEVGENIYWMPLPEPPKEGE